jgi:hypothetical protein
MPDAPYAHIATGPDRKVHFEFEIGHLTGQPSCGSGTALSTRIATLADTGGQAETIAALAEARVALSRLCRRCFSVRFRLAYARHLETA